MGIRPTVRGSVMNPNDHPHGGGEGKTGIGRPGPCTPWGKPALGLKTRKKNKKSNKLIVRRRDGKSDYISQGGKTMARSLKKGPFADESLLKKVDAMNDAGDKQLSRPGPAVPQSSRRWLVIQSQYMTEEDMYRYT